jgi:hypothetical protein
MSDEQALGQGAVNPQPEAQPEQGQSSQPEVRFEAQTEANRPDDDVIQMAEERARKSVEATLAQERARVESERRAFQSQADKKMAELERKYQMQIAQMKSAHRPPSEQPDAPPRAEAPEPVKAAQEAALARQRQQIDWQRQRQQQMINLEQQAIAYAKSLGLKREDFAPNEWGNNIPIDVWKDRIALPKAMKKLREETLRQATQIKVDAEMAAREEVKGKAEAGILATEGSGGSGPLNAARQLKALNKQGPPEDPRDAMRYLKKIKDLHAQLDRE